MGCLDSRLSLQGLADNARSRREASVILPFQTQKYQRRISQTMSSVKRKWIARKSSTADCLRKLRQLSLEQFQELMISLPRTDYASLSSVLPRMASTEVQRLWTGSDGANLLAQTNTFVRMVSENFPSISGWSLSGKRILDFWLWLWAHFALDAVF
jgi:hypothetical protein